VRTWLSREFAFLPAAAARSHEKTPVGGTQINQDYRRAYEVSSLSREQVADVLVDLKRRIQGNFFVIEEYEDKIVLGNTACPFAEKVIDSRREL
jgi:hypothetical protein